MSANQGADSSHYIPMGPEHTHTRRGVKPRALILFIVTVIVCFTAFANLAVLLFRTNPDLTECVSFFD